MNFGKIKIIGKVEFEGYLCATKFLIHFAEHLAPTNSIASALPVIRSVRKKRKKMKRQGEAEGKAFVRRRLSIGFYRP